MGNVKETVWEMEPHTESKHVILRKYLDAWVPILSSRRGRVVFIDGFAGPGEYKNGKCGSPLIAIKSVTEHRADITAEVVFCFIEKDKKRYEHLKEKLEILTLPKNIKYECICGEFADVVEAKLDSVTKEGGKLAPTFAFIDPFGFKGVPFGLIKKLLNCEGCEVFITFMYEEINRFISDSRLEGVYDELYGTDEWKAARKKKTPQERLEVLHGLYMAQLKKEAEYVVSFKMINKSNSTDYFLYFATNHILGLKKMKESMWKADPSGRFEFSDATYNPNQTLLFGHTPNFARLKKLIVDRFKGETVSIEDLERFVVVETPFRETHYKSKILRSMEAEGELSVLSSERKKRGAYPPGTIIQFI